MVSPHSNYQKEITRQTSKVKKKTKTYARDFPLKTTGGATAANTQKTMWSCIKDTWLQI